MSSPPKNEKNYPNFYYETEKMPIIISKYSALDEALYAILIF